MKKYTWRIVICLVPLLISLYIVGVVFANYFAGRGGFKLGVDLVGGTILIYEVDLDKLPNGELPRDWNPQEVARRLKSRIDPGDIYNITIRVANSQGTRFEIILPTGGVHQRRAQQEAWERVVKGVEKFNEEHYRMVKYEAPLGRPIDLLAAVNAQYPKNSVPELKRAILKDVGIDVTAAEAEKMTDTDFSNRIENKLKEAKSDADRKKLWDDLLAKVTEEHPPQNYVVAPGHEGELVAEVVKQHPKANVAEVRRLIALLEQNPTASEKELEQELSQEEQTGVGPRKRTRRGQNLTTEQVQSLKELIASQGSLEFVILANSQNDKEALDAVQAFFKKVKDAPELKKYLDELAVQGKAPPITVDSNGRPEDPVFDTPQGRFRYRWIEMGSLFRWENGFANPRNPTGALLKPPPERNDPDYDAKMKAWEADENNRKLWQTALMTNHSKNWQLAYEARARGELLPDPALRGDLIYSRKDLNIRPSEKDRDKEYDYFVLCRMSKEGTPPITGEDVAGANPGMRADSVEFRMKPYAATRFREFTGENKGQMMAIVLDSYVQSAANIQEAIGTNGQITGMGSPDRVETVVKVLRSGPLQASLKPEPVSENTLGPTLGADTIKWGFYSVVGAFGAVLLFMLCYYRFAGVVACVALLANLLLTVAFMVAIDATFTLPGLAGLVLMLGMAVDANVLIYERLREERERNASIAQALRNGYEHALPTIIDTHLSSIFTAVVLYVVGNDQLKGFGISLTVGLIISLFTSFFMTRVMFDVWLAKGWLHKLSMASFKHWPGLRVIFGREINFMAIRYQVFAATVIITVLGAALFIYRLDRGGLNIDFMGGIAYSAELTKPLSLEELRELLKKTDLEGLTIEQTFVSAPGFTGENDKGQVTSKLFTVRAETPRGLTNVDEFLKDVQNKIRLALVDPETKEKELLKTIDLGSYQIMPDHREVYLSFVDPEDKTKPTYASPAQVSGLLNQELRKVHLDALAQQMSVTGLGREQAERYQWMKLTFPVAVKTGEMSRLETALKATQTEFRANPQPERLEKFDSQLAAETQLRALLAIAASWGAILLYLWFRFGSWTFGLAAVICLIHDLFFTLGVIAASHYFYEWFPGLARSPIFDLSDFKLDLPSVAALLTLVGYSVNDTIVVFDRIREVRGKNPALTPQMIDDGINQTLGRTLLASLTVFLVVVVLYYFGGEGVHLFAFVMVVGVIIGTLSSIYVASPLLLLFGEGKTTTTERTPVQPAQARS